MLYQEEIKKIVFIAPQGLRARESDPSMMPRRRNIRKQLIFILCGDVLLQ